MAHIDPPDRGARPERSGDEPSGRERDTHPGTDRSAGGGESSEPAGGDSAAAADDAAAPLRTPTPLTQQLGRVVLVVLLVLFAIFAVANSQPVNFSWVVGETRVRPDPQGGETGGVPLIVLLGAALVLGAAVGALTEWQVLRARRARREARRR